MRILHIVGDSKYGGASVIIQRMAEKAVEQGWEADVLTTDSVFASHLRQNNIGVVDINVLWRPINPIKDLIGLLKLFKYLKKNSYDVVHTHTSKGGFIGRIAARLANVPVIIHTVHGFAFHDHSSFIELNLYINLERFASRFCDRIVTVSRYHEQVAIDRRIAPKSKIIAIPNGVDERRIFPDVQRTVFRQRLGISNEIIILATGRLSEQKGYYYLVQAMSDVIRQSEKPVMCLIAGDGELREELEIQIKQLGLEEHIRLLGFRTDVNNLLEASDIVVIPSLWEGLSIALLEAMAAGKPIISTAIPSNLEVVNGRECALLVPCKDSNALSKEILMLIEDKDKQQTLGQKAREVFASEYSESTMLDRYIQTYLEVIEQKGLKS